MGSPSAYGPREQGNWNVPGAAPSYQHSEPAPAPARRGRPGLVALVVALVELAVVAAVGNQAVSKHLVNYGQDHGTTLLGQTARALTQFTWRVTPLHGDNHGGVHLYYSQWTAIAGLVVVSVLLSLVLLRGDVTFGRAWLGVWTAVVVAAFVGEIVGAFVTRSLNSTGSRVVSAVFDSTGGPTFVYGLLLGLLTGLIAGFVAVGTRRTEPAATVSVAPSQPAYVPEPPPPFYGTPQDARPYDPRAEHETTALPTMPSAAHSTQQLPELPEPGDNRTTQLPRFDPRGGQNWTPPESDGGSTQAMPTTPDDRDRH